MDSVLDSKQTESACTSGLTHVCHECTHRPAFETQKALLLHRRIRHKYRDLIVTYVDGSGVCPVCGTSFHSRLRCMAHLTDSRRTKCRDVILAGSFPSVSSVQLAKLEESDRVARRLAFKNGHSHALASSSAVTVDGKKIGFVQS